MEVPLDVDLGGSKRIRCCEWAGEKRVDIREWIPEREDLSTRPTKKGVSLPLKSYLVLHDKPQRLTTALRDVKAKISGVHYSAHLGANVYATVKFPYQGINLRKWFLPKEARDGKLLPGSGIFLKSMEWETLLKVDTGIYDLIPQLRSVTRCRDSPDHAQLGWLSCKHCNPDNSLKHHQARI